MEPREPSLPNDPPSRRRVIVGSARGAAVGLAVGPVAGFAGCQFTAMNGTDTPQPTQVGDLELTSPAFDDGGAIPRRFGKDHDDVNPALEIANVPDDAASLALVMDDPDAPGGTFVHWLVWNIPPDTTTIPEGWRPDGPLEGTNDFGNTGYGGPAPPETHTYRFILAALDTTVAVEAGARRPALEDAMEGHVVGQTVLRGTYTP